MTSTQAIPLAGVFVIMMILFVRAREVRAWVAAVIFLAGVYVGMTSLLSPIVESVTWIVGKFVS